MSERVKSMLGAVNFSTPKTRILSVTLTAVMTAMYFVCDRFLTFYILGNSVKIGFSFVPVVVSAMMCGPISSMLTAGLGDLLGSLLMPVGTPMPLLTVTAALSGLVFGLFLYGCGCGRSFTVKKTVVRAICAVVINQLVFSIVCNTFALAILFSPDAVMSYFFVSLPSRAIKAAVMIPIEVVFIMLFRRMPSMIFHYQNKQQI